MRNPLLPCATVEKVGKQKLSNIKTGKRRQNMKIET